MSKRNRNRLEMGHDSFLDIVANLVGILIILVVVLGTQTATMIEEALNETPEATEIHLVESQLASDRQLEQLARRTMHVASARSDSDRLERLVTQYDQELGIRSEERTILMMLLDEGKSAWQEQQAKLDQAKVRSAKRESQFALVSAKLNKLEGEIDRLRSAPEKVIAVQHLPTPMAKTVFGEEIHLRIKDNRVAIVPLEQLIAEVQRDLERSIGGSRDGEMQGAVGPIRGSVARFLMTKSRGMVNRGGKSSIATRVQVIRMTAEPLAEPFGQPIESVLSDNSEVEIELAGRDPGTTTVTAWVYPESYAAFRRLKEWLYAKGFATAARPLSADGQIGVSPHGSKSNAQ